MDTVLTNDNMSGLYSKGQSLKPYWKFNFRMALAQIAKMILLECNSISENFFSPLHCNKRSRIETMFLEHT